MPWTKTPGGFFGSWCKLCSWSWYLTHTRVSWCKLMILLPDNCPTSLGDLTMAHITMGQNPVPLVNIPIPTKINYKWVVRLPQNGTIGVDPRPYYIKQRSSRLGAVAERRCKFSSMANRAPPGASTNPTGSTIPQEHSGVFCFFEETLQTSPFSFGFP